ncbi:MULTISPECIES: hypothetical protein [unclassified Sphingomonas]|uniref:hypothetical protein n=1 Tax=unclassified Sphingomonas TaxID=196159 RepID=UPI00286512FC|nr:MULTISPECIES: hypothetical protein [unclassified Sphingomonas]MDR6115058.1 hypothetical protein [Sphingomonas sp. SORGH_AS_0789]MDR6151268.1 hypothetical protein [Sphingomonas sp. SORGH_AS_0742]
MEELDMSGVDPLRRAEVRRRIGVIKDFIGIAKPNDADRKSHADRLDLSVGQFLALVRAWKEYRRPSAISGSGFTKGKERRTGPRHLAAEVKRAARHVVAGLDAALTLNQTVAAVNDALAEQGLNAPSRSTIWNMVMDARRDRVVKTADDVVLVSRCWIRLPIAASDGAMSYPELVLAVRPSTGAIIAASMGTDEQVPARMAAAVLEVARDAEIRVENALADPFELAGARVTRLLSHNGRRELARALGRGFGQMRIVYQPARAVDPAEVLRNTKDQPLTAKDARDVVADLLLRHNAARQAPAATWVG